jgi:hypothetical protein
MGLGRGTTPAACVKHSARVKIVSEGLGGLSQAGGKHLVVPAGALPVLVSDGYLGLFRA